MPDKPRDRAIELLRKMAECFPSKQTLLDIHADDMSHPRKYPITITDNFMLEIYELLEKVGDAKPCQE